MSATPAVRYVFAVAVALLSAAPVAARESVMALPLVWAPKPERVEALVSAAPGVGSTVNQCYATPNNGTTVYSSTTAQAVRDALGAVAANGTVKVAGYCSGVQVQGGSAQTALITRSIILAGGYTATNWAAYNPAGNPTTLDALSGGRVIYISVLSATLQGFTVTNGYISSSLADNGGGIYATGALTLSDMVISGNIVTGTGAPYGGGAHAIGAVLISNTTFFNNQARGWYGGGLYVIGEMALIGGRFISNTSRGVGGGAAAWGATTLIGGLFAMNVSGRYGGGLYALGTLAMTGTQFIGNAAGDDGGGAAADGPATLTGGLFQRNSSGSFGGGLQAYDTLALTDTQFISNTTTGLGGGASVVYAAILTGGVFRGNAAAGDGGGLYAYGTVTLTGSQFISNASGVAGGGLSAQGAVTLTGGVFASNTSSYDGGGLNTYAALALINTQFSRNRTGGGGGGAFAWKAATVTGGLFQDNISLGGWGGGLFAGEVLALTAAQFISNSAEWGGGGAAALTITLAGGLFQDNRSPHGPGGGAHAGAALTLSGTQFMSNSTPGGSGGGPTRQARRRSPAGCFKTIPRPGALAGLYVQSTSALTNTQFIRNSALNDGGGVFVDGLAGPSRWVNALFAGNRAGGGGQAIYAGGGLLSILHATIVSPSLAPGAAFQVSGGAVSITNTLIATHTIGIGVAGGTVGDTNTLFAGVSTPYIGTVTSVGGITGTAGFVNPAADDYHLGAGSAALNAGIDAGVYTDFEDQSRPQASGFDIGYDESPFAPLAPRAYLPFVVR